LIDDGKDPRNCLFLNHQDARTQLLRVASRGPTQRAHRQMNRFRARQLGAKALFSNKQVAGPRNPGDV
jgi:hypothetical protein